MIHRSTAAFLLLAAASACSSIPTIDHCDMVEYSRNGNLVHIEANCRVPMDDGGMSFTPADIMSTIAAAMMFF